MNATQTGLLAGLVLGLAGAFGGPRSLPDRADPRRDRADRRPRSRRPARPQRPARTGPRPVTRLPAVEDRGRLDIHPTVLRKIVEHAADQVPGTLRHERRLAGIDIGEAGASARVTTGSGDPPAVDIRLELTL